MGSKVQWFKVTFLSPDPVLEAYWQLCGKTSIFYKDFGSSILSLFLTLNVEPLSKIPQGGEPVNAYEISKNIPTSLKHYFGMNKKKNRTVVQHFCPFMKEIENLGCFF
jgi:hypothetical protein